MKNLVKVSAVAVITLLSTLSGQATVVLTPNQVPIDAYVNGSDGNQHFIQMFDFTFVGTYNANTSDIILISLPDDITVANVNVDASFNDEIAMAYETANDPTFAATASETAVTLTVTSTLSQVLAAGDRLWVMIPVVVASTASGTANYTVTFTFANDGGLEGGPFSIPVSYKTQLSLIDWDDGFFEDAGGDGRVETDDRGKFFPDGATSTVVDLATLPDFLIDEQLVGGAFLVEQGTITLANWDLYTTNAWGTNSELNAGVPTTTSNEDDMEYLLWASQDGDLGKVNTGNAQRVIDFDSAPESPGEWPPAFETKDFFDASNPLNATDPQTGIVFSEQLAEGDWYFYATSSATGDWALGRSDTIEVRHRPVFADYAAPAGQGVSFDDDFNGIFDMGTDGTETSLVIESGGSLDIAGAFDPANNRSSVDVFWDIEDTDDNAIVQVYFSTNGGLTVDELVISGTEPDEVVDALTGATRLDTTTILEESSTVALTFDSFTSASDFVTAGIYFVYVVLNDGKTQNLQIANETAANAAVPVTITHAPFFAFHPYNPGLGGAITLDSKDDQFYTISWGNPPVSGPTTNVDGDQDADAASTAVIQLYYAENNGGAGLVAGIMADPIDRTNLDAQVSGGTAALIATITDDGDERSDNRFEWDFRAAALTSGGGETYFIYGVMTHGSNLIIAQLNENGTPQPVLSGDNDDSPITFAHSDYLRPITPYDGPPIELDANDIFELRWQAFNQDPTGIQEVQAVMVTEGVANPGNADYVVWVGATYQTTDFVWLLDGNDGGIPLVTDGAAAAAGSATIQISDLDNTAAGAGAPASGNYEVYYFFNDDGATGFGATHTAVRAPGKIFLTGSTTDPTNFEIQPHKSLITTGDTLTFNVFAQDDGSANNPNMVSIFIDIPESANFSIIDQDATADGIQPFIRSGNFTAGVVLMNTLTSSGSTHELNYLERIPGVVTVDLAGLTQIAQFQVAMITTLSDPFQDIEVIFASSDPRVTNLYDADGSAQATSIPAVGMTLRLTQQGALAGFVDVEGVADAAQVINIFLSSSGALDPLTDANYLAANGDADGSDGIQVTLGAGGSYSLVGIPNGEFDVRVTKSGYLDQISSNITIVGLVEKDLHFTGGSKLFGGDAAGFDDDGDATTFSIPDNRIDSDDTDAISTSFGLSSGDSDFNAFADIDQDGTVGVNDLFLASRNLGTDGDGVFYKNAPYFEGNNGDAVVWLASEESASGAVTFTVQATGLSSLSAYSVSMEVSPTDWELVEFSDELSTYMSVINLGRFSGYDGIFASAAVGARAFRGSELALMAITLMPRVEDPAEPGLVAVAMVSGNGDLSSPVISAEDDMLPMTYTLSQNFPNPFNPTTSISFGLPASGYVKLAVYNILGREVRTLVSSPMEAGSYQAEWNSTDNIGRKISSGIYFYRLIVDNKVISTKKMILLK